MSTHTSISPDSKDKPPVVFLLAVWGKSYIQSFFDFGLRSLLAPGNIPAMSQEYACTFLFLTTEADISFFQAQPPFQQLMNYCQIEFIEISDLIFDGSYSASLTLAYERGMRSRGEKMCETYFFFLVSDYLMANGSLQNMGRYLKAGYSGITTGNFLVVEEYVSPLLKDKIEADKAGLLTLSAHEMLTLAFPFLHPVSLGHTVTQSFTHATHANRLFWKVNDHVMIGRFYLRHMLCIKPEIDDYVIGASCDYSFIPEMCPSGNVAHIQDSDDYCVIEMAPFDYEQPWLACGGHDIPTLANHLSNWTTNVHRANAHFPVIYHSKELHEPPRAAIQASAEFIQTLETMLSPDPQPLRGHPYWISCIESIMHNILEKKTQSRHYRQGTLAGFIGSATFSPVLGDALDDRRFLTTSRIPSSPSKKMWSKARLRAIMTGTIPHQSPWHLNWFDDYHLKQNVKEQLSQNTTCIVIAFEPIDDIMHWLESGYPRQCTYQLFDVMMKRHPSELQTIFNNKTQASIWLNEDHFCELGAALRLCAKYLPPTCSISVYCKHKTTINKRYFRQMLAIWNADLMSTQITCEKVQAHYNIPRALLANTYARYTKKLFAPRKHLWTRIIGLCGLSLLDAANLFGNLLALCGLTSRKKNTSAIVHFRKMSDL